MSRNLRQLGLFIVAASVLDGVQACSLLHAGDMVYENLRGEFGACSAVNSRDRSSCQRVRYGSFK